MLAHAMPTPAIESSSRYLVMDERDRKQAQRATQQAEACVFLRPRFASQARQRK